MTAIHITDIEAAINFWRQKALPSDSMPLQAELDALAEIYAVMAFERAFEVDELSLPATAMAAWLARFRSTPDTPCIAICSTSQGDDLCKGCGRTFDEVQRWTQMHPVEKRATWRRITQEGTAWRVNRYAERANSAVSQ